MISRNLALVLSLFEGVTRANIFSPAGLAPIQQLEKRNPYYGGYALRQGAKVCPKSTQTCATGFCCPANTWCSENINGPYCCPTTEDCGAVVGDAPTCADPSWTLFMDAYAFCCQSGDVGIQGEQCQPKSLTFSAALYAATSSQANTALPPVTRAGGTLEATGAASSTVEPASSTTSATASSIAAATGTAKASGAQHIISFRQSMAVAITCGLGAVVLGTIF